ncbi:uncharacterized protein EV154DRAFT_480197 [Mucor mucedo]|nr:uncharacterized protein EV154DRAFT_480197 [Mucor mucedo]KAI7892468.1 hypothetical protein EV154DRAFT_480197 [Mucor mucedo]
MKMFIRFATLGLIAAVVMSSVSAEKASTGNNLVASGSPAHAAALPVKRTSLSRRKVASLIERRRRMCDHHNHRNYHDGDEIKHHYRPRHRHCGGGSIGHCDSDDYDDYNDEYDFDDEDYYECDECDECDGDDFGYMSWEDYEDEITK